MVYATCSVLPEENAQQMREFLSRHPEAQLMITGDQKNPGQQHLPHAQDGDGFFYAKLIKA